MGVYLSHAGASLPPVELINIRFSLCGEEYSIQRFSSLELRQQLYDQQISSGGVEVAFIGAHGTILWRGEDQNIPRGGLKKNSAPPIKAAKICRKK